MGRVRPYNGHSRPHEENRKKFCGKQFEALRRDKRLAAFARRRRFNVKVNELLQTQDNNVVQAAAELGVPTERVHLSLGARGAEHRRPRKPNGYNGWVSQEMARINSNLPSEEHLNLKQFKHIHGHRWQLLSHDEKVGFRKVVEETRASREAPSVRKVGVASQADVNATIRNMKDEADRLFMRTGYHVSFYGCRTSIESNAKTFWYNQPLFDSFLDISLKTNGNALTRHMEAFAIGNTSGLAASAKKLRSAMRDQVVALISLGLVDMVENSKARMIYQGYFNSIVKKYHVDIIGWPLKRFVRPTELGVDELKILYAALISDPPTCYWKRLTKAEFARRLKDHEKADSDVATPMDVVNALQDSAAPALSTTSPTIAAASEERANATLYPAMSPPAVATPGPEPTATVTAATDTSIVTPTAPQAEAITTSPTIEVPTRTNAPDTTAPDTITPDTGTGKKDCVPRSTKRKPLAEVSNGDSAEASVDTHRPKRLCTEKSKTNPATKNSKKP